MRLLLTLIAVVAISSAQLRTTEATVINYGNFVGSTVSFNGVSENPSFNPTPTTGLFGGPTVMNNTLFFAPLSFESSVSGIGSQNRNSVLSVSLVAQPLYVITGYQFTFFGDYGLTIPFSPPGTANIGASIDMDVAAVPSSISFGAFSGSQPGFSSNFNLASSLVDIAPTTAANLVATGALNAATTSLFNDAFVKFKGFSVTITTEVIPEPSSALIFLGLGLVGLSSRRRR